MNTYLNPDAIQDRSIEPIKLNSAIIEITYDELKALRDNAQLIPGQQYRIIDFVTTSIASGTYKSIGKQFDVIVVADSENTLNENARAIQHEGDTYFKDCNLAAWKLKYSLDARNCDWVRTKLYIDDATGVTIADVDFGNDYVVFEDGSAALVDSGITYDFFGFMVYPTSMKDMFVLSTGYMPGGVAFHYNLSAYFTVDKSRVYIADDDTTYYEAINENDINTTYYVSTNYNAEITVYKYVKGSVSIPADGEFDFFISELSSYAQLQGILEPGHMSNDNTSYDTEFKGVIYRMIDEHNNDCPYDFKNIIYRSPLNISTLIGWYFTFSSAFPANNKNIYATLGIGNGDATVIDFRACYNNTINPYYRCYNRLIGDALSIQKLNNNILGPNCYDNVFESGCYNNILANICYHNKFGFSCYNNSFEYGCYNNTFSNNCHNNSFGNDCGSNSFGNYCYNNSFGNYCFSNSFGNDCAYNSFGNYCYNNTFSNNCHNNSFGNLCYNNSFGNGCYNNSFGNDCTDNSFGNDCSYNSFGNDCTDNSFGNDCADNSFGNDCAYNSFGNGCAYNSFRVGPSSASNLRDYCNFNKFCDGCTGVILWNSTTASSTNCLQSVNVKIGYVGMSTSITYPAEIKILRSVRPINAYYNGHTTLAVDYGEKWRHITGNVTLANDDRHIICDNTSAITITLPTGWNGAEYYIHKRCSSSISNTIKTSGSQYISYGGESSTTEQRATSTVNQSLGTSKFIWDTSAAEWIRTYMG